MSSVTRSTIVRLIYPSFSWTWWAGWMNRQFPKPMESILHGMAVQRLCGETDGLILNLKKFKWCMYSTDLLNKPEMEWSWIWKTKVIAYFFLTYGYVGDIKLVNRRLFFCIHNGGCVAFKCKEISWGNNAYYCALGGGEYSGRTLNGESELCNFG